MANPERMEVFQVSPRAIGIDLKRSQYNTDFGHYRANTTTTFRAGMLVALNASQEIVKDVGVNPFGFTKYNKTTAQYAIIVDEYIQLTALVATSLAHATLLTAAGAVAAVRVASAVGGGGTVYTEGGGSDYTVNYTNGTVVRVGGSTIVSGSYVYVTYSYQLTADDLDREGHNFWLRENDVTIQANRVTVITGPAIIFTTQYDPSRTYDVNAKVYAGVTAELLEGIVTTSSTGVQIGRVLQPPTAADPWLGINYLGWPIA